MTALQEIIFEKYIGLPSTLIQIVLKLPRLKKLTIKNCRINVKMHYNYKTLTEFIVDAETLNYFYQEDFANIIKII